MAGKDNTISIDLLCVLGVIAIFAFEESSRISS
jgi:hypothetical protein